MTYLGSDADARCPIDGRVGSTITLSGSVQLGEMPVHSQISWEDDVQRTENHYRDGSIEVTRVRHTLISRERFAPTPSVDGE